MSSTDTSDTGMFKMMGLVMLALTLFTLICMAMAKMLGGHSPDASDPLIKQALIQRIAPVGQTRTAEMAAAEGEQLAVAVESDAASVSMAEMSAEDLYNGACAACHAAGVANAPKLGDDAAWAERNALGLEALVASVVNGKGAMPARGGSSYSDEDIQRAVQHLTGL